MNVKDVLTSLLKVVVEEAQQNPRFQARLEAVLGGQRVLEPKRSDKAAKLKGGRRTPAVLDPVDLARKDVAALRSRLSELPLDRLLDIVAEYGMDPGKLVMKWKTKDRVVDRIVEVAEARATKGDAFRSD